MKQRHFSRKRRSFARNALIGCGFTPFLTAFVPATEEYDRFAARAARLLDLPELTAKIGSAYLQRKNTTVSADRLQLIESILASIKLNLTELNELTEPELAGFVSLAIARDFTDEKVVFLLGWVLSDLEARLCALSSLSLKT